MSIKMFHLFFIGISILFSGWFGAWCFQVKDEATNGPLLGMLGIISFIICMGLLVYLYKIYIKLKSL